MMKADASTGGSHAGVNIGRRIRGHVGYRQSVLCVVGVLALLRQLGSLI